MGSLTHDDRMASGKYLKLDRFSFTESYSYELWRPARIPPRGVLVRVAFGPAGGTSAAPPKAI